MEETLFFLEEIVLESEKIKKEIILEDNENISPAEHYGRVKTLIDIRICGQ